MEENTMSRSGVEERISVPDTQGGEPSEGNSQKPEEQERRIDAEQKMNHDIHDREGGTETERRTGSRRVSRTVADDGAGSRRAVRSGADDVTGKRRAVRSGADERTGSLRAIRAGEDEAVGSRRAVRSGEDDVTGSRRAVRSRADDVTGSRRAVRSGADDVTGKRRAVRSGADDVTGRRRAVRSGADDGTGRRRAVRSGADERTESRRAIRSGADDGTGSRRAIRAQAERGTDWERPAAMHMDRSASGQTESVSFAREENRVRDRETQSGKFGLGHKKTRRSAIVYLFEDIGDAFVRAKNWCVRNYRTSIPAAICLVLVIVVACILVRNFRQQPAPVSENMGSAAQEHPLEQDAYEEVNLFFQKYYEASSFGDVDTYVTMRSYTDETERIRMQKKANYIDYYQNLHCYTILGPVENTYLAYVYYEVKFRGINTLAPGLKSFYVCTNDAGELYIYSGEVDQNVKDYIRTVSLQEDVKDLFTRVKVTYDDAVASDQDLKAFLEVLSENLKNEVKQALSELEAQNQLAENNGENEAPVEPTPIPEELEPTPTPEPQTDRVMTTDRVNVRSSASPEATKVGTVAAGTQLTRYESLENGWSKIDYEGSEAYIKTEYLQVVETTIGTVRTVDSVNIRASASEDATKLGTVSAGTTLDLIENQENGWSRILFNGTTAYVKSEYLE